MRPIRVAIGVVSVLVLIGLDAAGADQPKKPQKPLPPSVEERVVVAHPRPPLASFSIAPMSVTGGSSVQGTVALSGTVIGSNAVIKISTPNPGVLGLPASVAIDVGKSSVTFPIATQPVAVSTAATIEVTDGAVVKRAELKIDPAVLTFMDTTPDHGSLAFNGGFTTILSAGLTGPAPPGGAIVVLSSSTPALVSVPGFVKVQPGLTRAQFPAVIDGVPVGGNASVEVKGSYMRTASVILQLNPTYPESLSLSSSRVVGGSSVTGTLTLVGKTPTYGPAMSWPVQSNNSVVAVPSSVTFPAGMRQANFSIATSPVAQPNNATVTVAPWSPSAALTVTPPALTGFGFNPASASSQAGTVDGWITLNGPAASGVSVPLSWSNTDAASAPANVTVAAGATTASFKVTLKPVTAPTPFVLSAYYGGARMSATLTVTP